MDFKNIKVNYLFHSGFTVETENYILVFDYFKDEVDRGEKCIENGAIGERDLRSDKKIIVFSSHSHGDHFNPVILSWKEIRSDIKHVLSSDIQIDEKSDNIHFISAYEEINVDGISIKAYGSTDIGISFRVKVDSVSLFHAGDLNWWYWWDDTPEEIEKAERWFKDEVEKIKGENIDIAFFPVDQRLEHNYSLGAEYFIEKIKPGILIPMHFGYEYETTKKFAEKMKESNTKILEIKERGQRLI